MAPNVRVSEEMRQLCGFSASHWRERRCSWESSSPQNYVRLGSACSLSQFLSHLSFWSGLSEDSLAASRHYQEGQVNSQWLCERTIEFQFGIGYPSAVQCVMPVPTFAAVSQSAKDTRFVTAL